MDKEQFISELTKLFVTNSFNQNVNSKLSNMIIERLILKELTDENGDINSLEELNEFKGVRNFGFNSFFHKLGNEKKVFASNFSSFEELLSALSSKPEELIEVSHGENICLNNSNDSIINSNEALILYENLLLPYYKSLGFTVSVNNEGKEVIQLPVLAEELYGDNNPLKVEQLKQQYMTAGATSEEFDFVYENCGVEREALSMPFAPSELSFISTKLKEKQISKSPRGM